MLRADLTATTNHNGSTLTDIYLRTGRFSLRHFDFFQYVLMGTQKQMISHLKALKNPFRIRKKKQENFHPQCNKTDLNEKVPLLVRASFCALWIELYQFSLLLSKGIVLGFLKRYIPPSYLKGLRNGS